MDVRPSLSVTPPPLVGRDRELALLREHLSAAQQGRGCLVLISGEAGIGKTALANRLSHYAGEAQLTFFAGRCYDRTETPPYGPWDEIARGFETLRDSASDPPIPRLDDAASQSELFGQTRDFLVSRSMKSPLILLLEDLHWADPASLDLLRFVARGIDRIPLLLIATYRDEELGRRHPLAGMVPLLVREASTERLNLRPLDMAAAQALVRARYDLPEPSVDRLAAYLIDRTEGNALFMTELLRSLDEAQLLERLGGQSFLKSLAQTPVPALLKQIVDERLNRLGDEIAALLAFAAVVGQEVRLSVWEAVTRAEEEKLVEAVEHAARAHLIAAWPDGQGFSFTHALVRDVLYEDVPAPRRRRLHRQVAEALVALPMADPDAVASHFERAGDDRAAHWLVRAAERAEDAHAHLTAAMRYEAALRLLDAHDGDVAERAWLRLLAAELRRFQDLNQALGWVQEAARLATTLDDPSLSARAQALLGLLMSYRGENRAAVEKIAAAADLIDRLPPGIGTVHRREQRIDQVANRGTLVENLGYGGRLTEARAMGEAYLAKFGASAATAAEIGMVANVHSGLSLAYAFQGEPELARRSYDAAVSAYLAIDQHVWAFVNLREDLIFAVLPYQTDNVPERERVAEATERAAAWVVERGGHANPHLPQHARIPLLVLEGRWREARAVLDLPGTPDHTHSGRLRAYYLGVIARAQGDTETAWRCVHERPLIRPASEPGEGNGQLPVQFQRLAAGLALDAGDLPTARRWLDLHRRWLDFMDATLGRSELEEMESAWHRAAGDAVGACNHAERSLALATAPRQPLSLLAAHRMLGVLAGDAGHAADAEHHFTEALDLADACRSLYERALTLIAHAEFLAANDDQLRARVLLDQASVLCLPMDAMPALARIELLAARLEGPVVSFPVGLTPREVEVLRLVATGLSNSEIAIRLFVSPNTVRVHVASILGKIGVHNRAAATEYAIRHGIA